ncbi:MAG: hypothetical protein AAFV32_10235 [Myxococcota bacterium]
MRSSEANALLIAVAFETACFVSGGRECGDDTSLQDGECASLLQCGSGTELRDGACAPPTSFDFSMRERIQRCIRNHVA